MKYQSNKKAKSARINASEKLTISNPVKTEENRVKFNDNYRPGKIIINKTSNKKTNSILKKNIPNSRQINNSLNEDVLELKRI